MAEDETRLEVAPRGTPAWHFAGNITLSEKSSGNDKHRTGSLVTRQRHRTGPLVTREGPAALERGRRRLFKLVRADGPRKRAAGKRPSLGSDPVSQELDPGALCRARSHLLAGGNAASAPDRPHRSHGDAMRGARKGDRRAARSTPHRARGWSSHRAARHRDRTGVRQP